MTQEITIEDIELPPQIALAIMNWWNSDENLPMRDCSNYEATLRHKCALVGVRVALLALVKEPILISDAEVRSLQDYLNAQKVETDVTRVWLQEAWMFQEFQRRMFLRKTDPVPDEVKALMVEIPSNNFADRHAAMEHNEAVIKALEIGKRIGGAK